MFLQPGMVGRALDREVESEFESVVRALPRASAWKSSNVPSCRMQGIVATVFGRADGVRAARIVFLGDETVVAALAVALADRMDGREVQHVEAHRADGGQTIDHVAERAVMRRGCARCVAERSREQLVPRGEGRGAAFRVDREDRIGTRRELATVRLVHVEQRLRCEQRGDLGRHRGAIAGRVGRHGPKQIGQTPGDVRSLRRRRIRERVLDELASLDQLERHVEAGREFLVELVAVRREDVAPRFDRELVSAHPLQREARRVTVVRERLHPRLAPVAIAGAR